MVAEIGINALKILEHMWPKIGKKLKAASLNSKFTGSQNLAVWQSSENASKSFANLGKRYKNALKFLCVADTLFES